MSGNLERNRVAAAHGSLTQLGETREIAIYQRAGVAWVADFRGGRGELFTAGEWFALNGRGSVLRRALLERTAPLPQRVAESIERLHGVADRALPAAPAARLRDRLAAFFRELCETALALSPRS